MTALANSYVARYKVTYPEFASTYFGFTDVAHDRFSDNSLVSTRRWQVFEDSLWTAVESVPANRVAGSPAEITLAQLREVLTTSRARRVCREELWPVNALSGWQTSWAQIAAAQPVGKPEARDAALERWRSAPRFLNTEIANLREGLRTGYTAPAANVRATITQLDALLAAPVDSLPFTVPASQDTTEDFQLAYRSAIADSLLPAATRYRDFLDKEYLPKAGSPTDSPPEPRSHCRTRDVAWPPSATRPRGRARHPIARLANVTGFVEGWGQYSEWLADEMGVYTTPRERLGRYGTTSAPLVIIDIGLSVLGWTTEQAEAYALGAAPLMSKKRMQAVIPLILGLPGYVASYTVGAMEFRRMREDAQRALGPHFDVRDFHEVVLRDGGIPLSLVRLRLDRWVRERRTATGKR